MLAPASFAMAWKETEEEYSQELNERMHTLIGYSEEDWNKRLMSEIQIALDEIKKFKVIFKSYICSDCGGNNEF